MFLQHASLPKRFPKKICQHSANKCHELTIVKKYEIVMLDSNEPVDTQTDHRRHLWKLRRWQLRCSRKRPGRRNRCRMKPDRRMKLLMNKNWFDCNFLDDKNFKFGWGWNRRLTCFWHFGCPVKLFFLSQCWSKNPRILCNRSIFYFKKSYYKFNCTQKKYFFL
jgi:hypothetical protein